MTSQAAAELARRQREREEEAAARWLEWFVRYLWPVVEPRRPIVWGRHMSLICARVEASYRGTLAAPDLVVNVPPRCSKSSLVAVLGPAWWWLHQPEAQFLALTKADRNAARDARLMRRVVKSVPYRRLLARMALKRGEDPASTWTILDDQDQVHDFANSLGGRRVSSTTTSESITGSGADTLIIDDPHDAEEVSRSSPDQTARLMREARTKLDEVWTSRLNPGGRIQLIMQRLHQADLAGVLLERGASHLVLPWAFEANHPHRSPDDWRHEEGELLAPDWLGADIQQRIADAPASVRAGQYQQRPTAQEGGLFKRAWFGKRYRGNPHDLQMDEWAISLDATFKDKSDADFVVFGVWGRKGADRYRLGHRRARMSYTATKQALRDLAAEWPQAGAKLVEDKANGSALIDDLRREIPGLIPFEPGSRSKYERAAVGSAPLAEAGNIWLPESEPWVGDWIEEHCAFPNGANDDQVDECSQMMLYWQARGSWGATVVPLLPGAFED